MVFRKKNYQKRSFKKKSYAPSGGGGTLAKIAHVANTALSIGKMVAAAVNSETKFYDINNSLTTSNTAVAQTLCDVPLGNLGNQRNGNEIRMKSIEIKYQLYASTTLAIASMIRVILFQDDTLSSQSAVPGISDLLESTGTSQVINSPINMNNRQRFKILFDRTYDILPNLITSYGTYNQPTGPLLHHDTMFVSLDQRDKKGEHLFWDESGTSGITHIRGKPIYILFISDDTTSSANPLVNYWSRMRFKDN